MKLLKPNLEKFHQERHKAKICKLTDEELDAMSITELAKISPVGLGGMRYRLYDMGMTRREAVNTPPEA